MKKSYQMDAPHASVEIELPEQLTIGLSGIAASAKEGLLALAVGTGLQVMEAMFAEDVQRLCGPKGKHNEARAGYRHGSQAGCVALGGRRLVVERPRVRSAGAHGELALPSYELFSSVEVLHRLAMERMLAGLSTRRYGVGQEPVGEEVSRAAKGTSRSAVSRRFVAATESALAELLARPLADLDLVALMIDGVHFAESCCVVALGIDISGAKHPLALVEGSTKERDPGAGAARRSARTRPRCEQADPGGDRRRRGAAARDHRRLRVPHDPALPAAQDQECPGSLAREAAQRRRAAHAGGLPRRSSVVAEAQLLALASELERSHPGAAASLTRAWVRP